MVANARGQTLTGTTGHCVTANISWQAATVTCVRVQTPRAKAISLRPDRPFLFRPGQYLEVRVPQGAAGWATAAFSIASPPELPGSLELVIQAPGYGPVASHFHDVAQPGDRIALRGPFGNSFAWTHEMGGPLLLVAGGSGVVPLLSMIRHRRARESRVPALLLYSAPALRDVIFRDELNAAAAADPALTFRCTLTQSPPPGWTGLAGRVNDDMLSDVLRRLRPVKHAYVCGGEEFVATVVDGLRRLGISADAIHTAGFGGLGHR